MWAVNQEPGMPGTGEPEVARPVHQPSLMDAIVPLVTFAVPIGGSLLLFGLDALDGPIQVALTLCVLTAALIATVFVAQAAGATTI